MKAICPYCQNEKPVSDRRSVIRSGYFKRRSDSRLVQKYRCQSCLRYFSQATGQPCFRQKRRNINERLRKEFASGVSQRRLAILLHANRKTVVRKFLFLGQHAVSTLEASNTGVSAKVVQFDDLETFEHSKCKPLSVTLAVEHKSRRILGFEVSRMPAKGPLAKISVKKYGVRKDERAAGRKRLFKKLTTIVCEQAEFHSDQNPFYPKDLKRHFPNCRHLAFEGKRGSVVGQGELKRVRFDPLFSLNHTCAMLRSNINRLQRKTWSTTKIPERLALHIAIYAVFHNLTLLRG